MWVANCLIVGWWIRRPRDRPETMPPRLVFIRQTHLNQTTPVNRETVWVELRRLSTFLVGGPLAPQRGDRIAAHAAHIGTAPKARSILIVSRDRGPRRPLGPGPGTRSTGPGSPLRSTWLASTCLRSNSPVSVRPPTHPPQSTFPPPFPQWRVRVDCGHDAA